MKKIICVSLFVLFSVFIFAEQSITISQIKILIDNSEFSWKEAKTAPNLVSGDEPKISCQTVLSFTSLQPEKRLSLSSFETEIRKTETRLNASGYFYTAKVSIIPPRKNPEKRTVIITVQTGFFWRFGGGNLYGVFGRDGIGGKRLSVLGYLGWNKNGASVTYKNAFGSPLILGSSLFWDGPKALFSSTDNAKSSNFDGLITVGAALTPDVAFCTDIAGTINSSAGFVQNNFCVSPSLSFQEYYSDTLTSNSEMRAYVYPLAKNKMVYKAEAATAANWTPTTHFTLAVCFAGGVSSETFAAEKQQSETGKFSLNPNYRCLSENSGLVNRIIRSGYKTDELVTNAYIFSSVEARWNAAQFSLPPAFTVKVQPFLFADAAYTQENLRDAYGAGVRVLLDNPVFAYFTFSYGVNHDGNGKFCFSATKGF